MVVENIIMEPHEDPNNEFLEICKECYKNVGYCTTGDPYECLGDALTNYDTMNHTNGELCDNE